MAIARDTTAANIKPLANATVDRFDCGSTVAAGELVVMSSDDAIDPADTTSAAQNVLGVAVQGGAVGDRIDVVTAGRINCVTGGTAGSVLHASDTAGEPAESAGTNAGIAGLVLSPTIVLIRPVTA